MVYVAEGLDESRAVERAEEIFNILDFNKDGDISKEEFINGCMADDELVQEITGVSKDEHTESSYYSHPRNSISVENRDTTRRRYMNLM